MSLTARQLIARLEAYPKDSVVLVEDTKSGQLSNLGGLRKTASREMRRKTMRYHSLIDYLGMPATVLVLDDEAETYHTDKEED